MLFCQHYERVKPCPVYLSTRCVYDAMCRDFFVQSYEFLLRDDEDDDDDEDAWCSGDGDDRVLQGERPAQRDVTDFRLHRQRDDVRYAAL